VASTTTGFKKNIMNFVTNFVPPSIIQKRNYEESSSFMSASILGDSPPLGEIDELKKSEQLVSGTKATGQKSKFKFKPSLADLSARKGKNKMPSLFAVPSALEGAPTTTPKPHALARQGKKKIPNLFALSPISEAALPTMASSEAQPPQSAKPSSLVSLAARSSKNKPKNILSLQPSSSPIPPPTPTPPLPPPPPPPPSSVEVDEDKIETDSD
jgi:hypothetical protein